MDLASVVGLVLGTVVVMGCMLVSGSLLMYWDLLSLVIVMGGATFASIIGWPLAKVIGAIQVLISAFFNKVEAPSEVIDQIIELSTKARKESILALDKVEVTNDFLAKGVKLAVDGTDPAMIDSIMDEDISNRKRKIADGRGFIEDMGDSCPAFGMIGTVIGLIVIMANLSDPSKIGPGLAVALVTTLYGALAANLFFIPVAKKLKFNGKDEIQNFLIIKTGVLAIVQGTNPNIIREQLSTYIDAPAAAE